MQSITKFTETVATGLEKVVGIAHRWEVIKRLGLQAEFAKHGRKKYMDAVFCFADNVRVKGNAT